MALQSETITANDGDDATTPLNNPYYSIVYQNWPAYYQSGRWSGTLTAVLTPKAYAITYDLTGGVWASGVTAPAQHTWSFATAIPTPVREGYLFMGWQAETAGTYANGSVPAPVHQDVKLTAVWEKDELNQNDPENNGSDGIPDKYQRKLTFQVVHGAWNDGTAADLVYVVTLKNASSENAVDGTASVTVPAVGDKPDYGYKAGAWDTDPGAAVAVNNTFPEGTSGKTYTYTYIAIGDQDVTYKEPDNPDSVQDPDNDPEDAHQPVPYGTYIKIVPNGGVWEGKTEPSYVKIEAPYGITDPTRTDYIFMGWLCEADGATVYEDGIISYVFTAQWEQDVTGETGSGDTIPDCFQKSVIFAVKNGTWNGSDATDKSHVVTLTDAYGQWSQTGSADISALIPDVTAAQPNPGYQDPAWAPALPADSKVSGTAAETFTYTYVGNYILVQPNGGTWKGGADNACLLLLDDTLPLADPTREDHTFLGWQETADGVTVHADGIIRMVYTAQWIHDSQLVYPTTVTLRLDQVNTNVEDLHTGAQGIRLLANDGSGKTYDLIPGETGVYSEKVPAGTYYIHRVEGEHSHQIGDYLLTVNTHGGSRIIDHYSIGYDVNGGAWQTGDDPGVAIVFANTRQSTVSQTPVRDGYAFKGWKLGEKTYGSIVVFTDSITEKTVFTAVWEQLVDVKVNVTVNYARNDTIDNSPARDEVTFQLLRDIGGAKDPVQPAKTITEASHAGYDVTSGTESIRYQAVENTYEDLPAGDYTVSVTKSGYRAQVTTTTSGNLQTIDVVLTFNPDNFDLYFDVVMADGIPQELWPDAVNVKATYWGDDGSGVISWHVIDLAPVTVKLDASGKGSGHISVWKHLSGTADAYDYRVMVSGFVYKARAVTSADVIVENKVYSDHNYTATVTVPGGRTSGDGLDGSYYGTSAQVGRPLVTVTVEQYDVTFDANGGTVNGKPADTVTDVYAIPAFSGFVPVRESYVFGGWYQDQACTIPAVEGKLLTGNVTLYAKWSPIQSITGNVTVEGVYTHNGQLVEVHAIARTTKINVALQVFDTVNGTLLGTVQNKQIGLTWPETPTGDGTGTYSFTDLQALPAGQRYRVLVYMTNYQSFYLNEDSVGNQFTENANLAVFKTDPTATYVHADLIFDPDSYDQKIKVDASAIGEGFRPTSAKAQILAWEQGTTIPYRIISQHDVAPYGLPIAMDTVTGYPVDYHPVTAPDKLPSESVWKWNWTGKLYDYRAQLSELNGKPYTTDPRFSVSYSNPVCWNLHGNEAPGALTITLEPNTFDVIFDMNAPGMENMVETDLHHWSHATDVSGILPPARSGYVFMGWYATPDHSGQPVTHIDPAVYTDTTLYAYWEVDVLEETPQAGVIGDGVPDIYQCVVTFEIVGGTWGQYGGSAPLQRVFTLWEKDASGVWSKIPAVTLGNRIPNNMIPTIAVDPATGHWNPAATVNTPVTGDATYTYTYRSAITATVVNGSFQMGSDPKTYVNTTHSIPHNYSTTEKCTVSFQPAKDHILLSATLDGVEIAGFTGAVTLPHDRDYNIYVVYTPDVLGPDGHPDIYQKQVNFVVKNGTWAGMNGASTITRYIPLYKDGKYAVDGTGTLDSIPTAVANQGYKLLGWDAPSPETVYDANTGTYNFTGTNEVTYTFTCVPTTTALYDYDVEHWRQQPDSRYALESSEHKQVSVELNAQGTDFEPGKEPVITLSELEYKNYGIHYTPCDGLHYLIDHTHDGPILSAQPQRITDRTLLKMYYCLNSYGLSYDLGYDSSETPEGTSKLFGNEHQVSDAPARKDYVFLHWQDKHDANRIYLAGSSHLLESNVDLLAVWATDVIDEHDPFKSGSDGIPDQYQVTVTYQVQDGKWADGTTADIKKVFNLYEKTPAGIWTKLDNVVLGDTIPEAAASETHTGSWNASITAVTEVTGNVTYVYDFEPLPTYTVSYNLNKGTGASGVDYDPITTITGKTVTVKAAPVKSGYVFDGYTFDGKIYKPGDVITVTRDVVLTAQWCELLYTVHYLSEETGNPLQSPKVVRNVNLHDMIDVSGEILETIITPDEKEYVFSHADKPTLTIIWDAANENSSNVINLYYEMDMLLDVEQDPSQSGGDSIPDKYQAVITYQVQGGKWADGTTADIKKVFTLYEKTPAGVWNKLDNVVLGDSIPKAEVSDTHTGAWYPAITTATEVTGNATYVYSFTALPTYTVSYDLNKGTGANGVDYAPVTVVSGKTVTVKAAPSLRGYAFDGYTFGGKTYKPGNVIIVTGDVVLTAQWDKIPDPVRPPASTTGSVVLTKCDAADHTTLLARVVFDLFTDDGDYVGTYTTNARGEIQVDNLRAGDYYWVETRPTEGYELDNREHSFTVSSGKTTEITVENARSEVPAVFSGDHYAYIIGYSDGMVHPQWKITRAEVATIFFRLLDEPTRSQFMTRSNSFSDVQPGMWFNTAVSTMASMGVINGYPNGTFQPNANITRAEFAAIAARFDAHGNTTGVSFSDIYQHWAYKEISIAANNGWILGYEDGTFKPNQHITRAEAMALVNRVLQRIPEHKSDLLHDMVQWPDNMAPTVWYYLTVQEATNSHDYGRKVSGYEYWINLREVPDWTALER